MNCVNCAAALQPVGNRPYFRCVHCLSFHFPQEIADGVAVLGGAVGMPCPVCEAGLTRGSIFGHSVGYCRECRGFLAENAVFGQIVRLRRAEQGHHTPAPLPFSVEELRRRIKCPKCQKLMDTHPYHAGGNAVVDTCHRCHLIWLDAGELVVIGEYRGRKERGAEVLTSPAPRVPTAPEEPPTINLFGLQIRLGE